MCRFPIVLVLFLCLSASIDASMGTTRGSLRSSAGGSGSRTIASSEVQMSLQSSLQAVLGSKDGATSSRLAAVEARMWQTFQALPKNSWGRLAPRAVRYIVHNYFAKEHGWLIEGLEPHGMQTSVSEVHEVSILQDKAPALVEALLEVRQADHGLALSDVVTMAVVLEQLIFDESINLLEHAYQLNGHSAGENINEDMLHEVLRSYLLVFAQRTSDKVGISESQKHLALKSRLAQKGVGSWLEIVEFESDSVQNFDYARKHSTNPFVEQQYSFEVASAVVDTMSQNYGKWQNSECLQMKEALMDLDPKGLGRIPLSTFYSQPKGATYSFTESADYLRKVGALDETNPNSPKVLIANYLLGPSNCIASSTYYSICCLSECEGLMNELEAKVQAPAASPERLIGLVSSMTSSSVDAPRQLPEDMKAKLRVIAEQHGGEVPLHGRLFAQWLHYAFPNECPFPQIAESTFALTPSAWLDKKAVASAEDRQQHIEDFSNADHELDFSMSQWTDHEVLIAHEQPASDRSALGSMLRLMMQVAALFAVIRSGLAAWKGANQAFHGTIGMEKASKSMLPIHHHAL